MIDESECFLLWAIPTWEHWAEFEKAQRTHPALIKWRTRAYEETTSIFRFLLVDAPLAPRVPTASRPAPTSPVGRSKADGPDRLLPKGGVA